MTLEQAMREVDDEQERRHDTDPKWKAEVEQTHSTIAASEMVQAIVHAQMARLSTMGALATVECSVVMSIRLGIEIGKRVQKANSLQ